MTCTRTILGVRKRPPASCPTSPAHATKASTPRVWPHSKGEVRRRLGREQQGLRDGARLRKGRPDERRCRRDGGRHREEHDGGGVQGRQEVLTGSRWEECRCAR